MKRRVQAVPFPQPNSQRDNRPTPVAGPGSQCHYGMIAIMAQQRIPEAASDDWIYRMIDDMELRFGRPGIGEMIRDACARVAPLRGMMRKRLGQKGELGAIANVHAHLMYGCRDFRLVFQCGEGYSADLFEQLVREVGKTHPIRTFHEFFEIRPGGGSILEIQNAIRLHGAVVGMSSMITNAGHFFPVVAYDEDGWWAQDTWGDWNTGYRDRSAGTFHYSYEKVEAVTHRHPTLRSYRYSYIKDV